MPHLSEDGLVVGLQVNKKNTDQVRKLRRFENYKDGLYKTDPLENKRLKPIIDNAEEDIDYQDEEVEENKEEVLSRHIKSWFSYSYNEGQKIIKDAKTKLIFKSTRDKAKECNEEIAEYFSRDHSIEYDADKETGKIFEKLRSEGLISDSCDYDKKNKQITSNNFWDIIKINMIRVLQMYVDNDKNIKDFPLFDENWLFHPKNKLFSSPILLETRFGQYSDKFTEKIEKMFSRKSSSISRIQNFPLNLVYRTGLHYFHHSLNKVLQRRYFVLEFKKDQRKQ